MSDSHWSYYLENNLNSIFLKMEINAARELVN